MKDLVVDDYQILHRTWLSPAPGLRPGRPKGQGRRSVRKGEAGGLRRGRPRRGGPKGEGAGGDPKGRGGGLQHLVPLKRVNNRNPPGVDAWGRPVAGVLLRTPVQ